MEFQHWRNIFHKEIFSPNPSKLSKGQNTIILTATDDNGDTAQGTVYIDVY